MSHGFSFKSIPSQSSDLFNGQIKYYFKIIYTFDLSINLPFFNDLDNHHVLVIDDIFFTNEYLDY